MKFARSALAFALALSTSTACGAPTKREEHDVGAQRDAPVDVLWSVGSRGSDRVADLRVLDDGSVIVAGTTDACDRARARSIGPLGGSDLFVQRVASSGPSDVPTPVWSVQLGGSDAERATAIAVAPDGSIYVAGTTRSVDLPVRRPCIQPRFAASSPLLSVGDAFLARLSPDGELLACTYLGREGDEVVRAMLVEEDGSLVVCGHTTSQVFETTDDALQTGFASASVLVPDGFVARIEPDLSRFRWSTLFGGRSADWLFGMQARPDGGYVCCGWHASEDLPVPEGSAPVELNGLRDALAIEVSRDGRSLLGVWSFGGDGFEQATALTVLESTADDPSRVFVTGWTDDADSFAPGGGSARRSGEGASHQAFLGELQQDGSVRTTVFGGPGEDHATAICIDRAGFGSEPEIIVVGDSRSDRFPIESARFRSAVDVQGFVLGFAPDLTPTSRAERLRFAPMSRPRTVVTDPTGLWIAGWAVGMRTSRTTILGEEPTIDSTVGFVLRLNR